MRVAWSDDAQRDLVKIEAFLAVCDLFAVDLVIEELISAAERVEAYPQLGVQLDGFGTRNVRQLIVANYELRYEVCAAALIMLRIWHARDYR